MQRVQPVRRDVPERRFDAESREGQTADSALRGRMLVLRLLRPGM